MRKRLVGFSVIAVTISVMALAAQQRPAPGPDSTTGGNTPVAPTSPAGSGGLQTGRGRGPAAPQGPAPHLPDGTIDLSGVWQGGGPVGDLAQGVAKGETIHPQKAKAPKRAKT